MSIPRSVHGGQTDFLHDDLNGEVLPLNDFAGFTAAVHSLVADVGKRHAIARLNKVDVKGFSMESCAKRYEALIRDVIARADQYDR